MSYVYVLLTVLLTVYGQLVIKWQVAGAGAFPAATADQAWFLAKLLVNPWIVSALAAALLAAMSWMAAMTRLDLSHAYPLTSLSFVLIVLLSGWLFHEPVTGPKIAGIALVCIGIAVGSQG